jgi:hypothetical protein
MSRELNCRSPFSVLIRFGLVRNHETLAVYDAAREAA